MSSSRLVAPGSTPRPRPRKAPSRAPRREQGRGTLLLLVTSALVALGAFGGYGIGQAVDVVRDAWPADTPALAAEKMAPPEPLDLSGPAEGCTQSAVGLYLTSDRVRLVQGDPIRFTTRVVNEGRVPCLVEGHASSVRVTVTDDEGERVWSSADCVADGSEQLLLYGDVTSEQTTRWAGSTSAPGCAGERVRVPSGTYTAVLTLDDVAGATSEPVSFTVAGPPEPEPDEQQDAEDEDAPVTEDEPDDAGQD